MENNSNRQEKSAARQQTKTVNGSKQTLAVNDVVRDFQEMENTAHRKGTFKIDAPFEDALDKILKAKPEPESPINAIIKGLKAKGHTYDGVVVNSAGKMCLHVDGVSMFQPDAKDLLIARATLSQIIERNRERTCLNDLP